MLAKTDLTRAIEKAIKNYHPSEVCGIRVNKFRGTHTAFEVPAVCGTTTGGIVDCMRIQEYFGNLTRTTHCIWNRRQKKRGYYSAWEETAICPRNIPVGEKPDICDELACRWCQIQEEGTAEILVTCFEIKITKSDFKSHHGHNFVGNCNYYVIPKELYPDVADLVPEDILFNTSMVKAIMAGEKTVTRRVVKPQPEGEPHQMLEGSCWPGYFGTAESPRVFAPPYHPGDILYVRETFFEHKGHYYYKADGKHEALDTLIGGSFFKWRPSIHMPKEAARLFLRVKNVSIEHLRNITMKGLLQEGTGIGGLWQDFYKLWDSTIVPKDLPQYGSEANPWVWVIEFEKITKKEAESLEVAE